MIKKNTILITSIGRTGTEFFSKFFADIIPDSTSLHEPDIVQFVGIDNKSGQFIKQIHRAGVWRMIVMKSLGRWSLIKLSDARFLSRITEKQASGELHKQREYFIRKQHGSVYVESNIGYYGLLDICPDVFQNYKLIYIVRDGRDWIRSSLNWGEIYGKKGIRKYFAHKWPTAKDVSSDPYAVRWDTFSSFERLCWAWTRLNEFALSSLNGNPNVRIFQFEKIFISENRYQYLDELLRFATALPGMHSIELGKTAGWLERRIHQSSAEFPAWENWSRKQKSQFDDICGSLMKRLGYKY